MMAVSDVGGTKRLRDLFQKITKQLPATMAVVASTAAAEAAVRAPSPQEEYQIMMQGEGNPEGITDLPPMPLSSTGSDGDHRMRFYKPPENYLQRVVRSSYTSEGMTALIGSVVTLNATSVYEWRNIKGDEYTNNFPFWECFEGGLNGTFLVVPRIENTKDPTLKPGRGKVNRRYYMYKSIEPRFMYRSINVDALIERSIIPAIKQIAEGGSK